MTEAVARTRDQGTRQADSQLRWSAGLAQSPQDKRKDLIGKIEKPLKASSAVQTLTTIPWRLQ